jgi:hypothetical protein
MHGGSATQRLPIEWSGVAELIMESGHTSLAPDIAWPAQLGQIIDTSTTAPLLNQHIQARRTSIRIRQWEFARPRAVLYLYRCCDEHGPIACWTPIRTKGLQNHMDLQCRFNVERARKYRPEWAFRCHLALEPSAALVVCLSVASRTY